MLYVINHVTTYEYAGMVSLSHHLLRLRPRDLPGQRCLDFHLHIDPLPEVLSQHKDYFGNDFSFATISGAHGELTVSSQSRVEVTAASEGVPADTLKVQEFLCASPLIPELPELKDYAESSFANGKPLQEAVLDLTARMHREFTFDATATNLATPLTEVLQTRRGVCQDFAQLQIGCLRAMGVPARYISGYLETVPPPGRQRLAGADASHAWVSFYSPDAGWIDVDPTNNLLVKDRHITVAWGRDYSDISPVRGMIMGGGDHSLGVAVDVIPQTGDSALPNA